MYECYFNVYMCICVYNSGTYSIGHVVIILCTYSYCCVVYCLHVEIVHTQ